MGIRSESEERLDHLFKNNRQWAHDIEAAQPGIFQRLLNQQAPQHMWIGCSDSRVPANEIVGLYPGEVFVHRNIANVVLPTDLNCLSTIQYAVDQLRVEHLMVVGHYGCGGVKAAMQGLRVGLVDNWLRHIADIHERHLPLIDSLPAEHRFDALCEINVIEQVASTARTTVVQDAWRRGQPVTVHGWIYGLKDGLLVDTQMRVRDGQELAGRYASAIEYVAQRPR